MRDGIHPKYDYVVFEDASCGFRFLTRSTIQSSRSTLWEDGKTYPHVLLDVSSGSHPVYTGKRASLRDTEGRIEKFNAKYGNRSNPLR